MFNDCFCIFNFYLLKNGQILLFAFFNKYLIFIEDQSDQYPFSFHLINPNHLKKLKNCILTYFYFNVLSTFLHQSNRLPYLETDCKIKVKSVHSFVKSVNSFEYKEDIYMKYEYENNMKTCEIIRVFL